MIQDGQLLNYIRGTWKRSRASEYLDVRNPETAETMVRVPLTPAEEVDEAIQAVRAAFPRLSWLSSSSLVGKRASLAICMPRGVTPSSSARRRRSWSSWPKEWSRKF